MSVLSCRFSFVRFGRIICVSEFLSSRYLVPVDWLTPSRFSLLILLLESHNGSRRVGRILIPRLIVWGLGCAGTGGQLAARPRRPPELVADADTVSFPLSLHASSVPHLGLGDSDSVHCSGRKIGYVGSASTLLIFSFISLGLSRATPWN